MKILTVLLAGLSISACASQSYIASSDIQYIEDQRSGLCFAVINSRVNTQQMTMTTVNCNDVKNLLGRNKPALTANEKVETATRTSEVTNFYRHNPFSTF